jgi:hypothetical protein
MLPRDTLRDIGQEVLAELRLSTWKARWTDMEPEVLLNRKYGPETAWNIHFELAGPPRFFAIWLRVPHASNAEQLRQSIKVALTERLREIA